MKTIDFAGLTGARSVVAVLAGVGLFLTAAATSAAERKESQLLTRTIYVPVSFTISGEMRDVTLTLADDDTVFFPMPRIFMFTYYPDQDEILPAFVNIRIHAKGCGTENGFDMNMVLTPTQAMSGSDSIDFSSELVKAARLHHRDIRLPVRIVKLRCRDHTVDEEATPTVSEAVTDTEHTKKK